MRTNFLYSALILTIFILVQSACTNPNSKQRPQPKDYSVVKSTEEDTVCFERSEGLIHKDITTITMYINKGDVSGHMIVAPSGKYSSVGTLAGNKTGEMINGLWIYTLQGKEDTMKINFKLANDKLYQQPFIKNGKNGLNKIDSTGKWSVVYHKVNCVQH